MFSATMTGQIQRIIHDNKKDKQDAMVKVVLAVSKQYSNDPKTSKIFPLVTIWGYDAAYLRKYAGIGQIITILNAEAEYYKNENKLDEDGNPIEQVTFKAGKVSFPKADVMKALVAAGVAEEAEGADDDDDDDDEDDKKSRRKKRKKKDEPKSRSSRRKRRDEDEDDDDDEDEDDFDEDEDDDDEEEEAPRKKKKKKTPPKEDKKKKKPAAKKKKKPVDDDDDDDEDDDDNYWDDED